MGAETEALSSCSGEKQLLEVLSAILIQQMFYTWNKKTTWTAAT